MRDQETDREGMAYQSLVDLPLNQSRSSQLSCLGSGIRAFDSKKCGAGSSLSTSSGQQLCSVFSADYQPVQLTSEDSCHPAQHVYSRRRLQSLSQGQATPEDQQSSPVASLPVAS
ncbi:hypothetical protein BC332_32822 [Capsicum chinense]|nr:hypothetical protein BC332_32822 [Capsicum chinense]